MKEFYTNRPSIGRNIERIRKIKDIKQETLASALGMTHQAVSKMEQSETIDDEKLEQVAAVLGVSADTIRNFDEQAVLNFTQNNFDGSNKEAKIYYANQACTFYPLDKYTEAVDHITRLYEELLKVEREKIALLTAMLKNSGINLNPE